MLVIVSNMKILISSYRINIWIIMLVFLSTALYFVIYSLESITESSQQFGTITMLAKAA